MLAACMEMTLEQLKINPIISENALAGQRYASFRYYETGFIFSDAGLGVFTEDETLLRYIGGFLNSFVSQDLIKLLSPTLNLTSGIIEKMPLIIKDPQTTMHVATLVDRCIQLEKEDFNETEISWNFSSNFLRNSQYVEDACALYIHQSEERKKESFAENQLLRKSVQDHIKKMKFLL